MSCRGPAIVIPHLMRNPGFFCSFLVPRFRGDDVWIPAGVYPREGGDGNDALGKLRRKRTHLLSQLIYVAHYNRVSNGAKLRPIVRPLDPLPLCLLSKQEETGAHYSAHN